jgi:hypothetical protein
MLELLIAGSNLFGSGWHFIYLTQNHFRFETKKKEYQSLGSLRESDPPSDASDATLFASMAEPIPEMAAEPLPGRPRFSRTIHGNFCERKFLPNQLTIP